MISTGQAARLLGVSRQHVVDLCTRGALPSVRVGTHRRIPQAEVRKLAGPRALTPEQQKSLWLHAAVAGALVSEPEKVLNLARQTVDRWRGTQRRDGRTEESLQQWSRLLDGDLGDLIEVLTSRSEDACELRPDSPFAGVLTPAQRSAVLRSYVAYRDRAAA